MMAEELIQIDVNRDDVYRLLSYMKTAEVAFGNGQQWQASRHAGRLHAELQKQIFYYEGSDAQGEE
jgi:hypothetical protein